MKTPFRKKRKFDKEMGYIMKNMIPKLLDEGYSDHQAFEIAKTWQDWFDTMFDKAIPNK